MALVLGTIKRLEFILGVQAAIILGDVFFFMPPHTIFRQTLLSLHTSECFDICYFTLS